MRTLGNPPPGIQASGSRCAVRRRGGSRRTVLGGKGSLRRGEHRRAHAAGAPFCSRIIRDDAKAPVQFLRNPRTSHLREALDLSDVRDRHQPGNDRHSDS